MSKKRTIPFNAKLSAELDRATLASESKDPVRAALGKRWKRSIEQKIWRETNEH